MPVGLREDGNPRVHHGTLEDGASTRATVTPPRVRNCRGGCV